MATKKGIARIATNIKSMSGVPSGALATLPVDGWVIGDLSPTGSDLINVMEWYRPTGQEMPLSVLCKVSVTNLTVTDYIVTPPPDPDPPPVENFSPPVELMARWKIGTDASGNPIYTEYFYYDLRPT